LKSIWIVHKLAWQCSIGDVKLVIWQKWVLSKRSCWFGDVELIWQSGVVDVDLAVWRGGIHKQETSSWQYSKHHKNQIDKITKQKVFRRTSLLRVDRLVSEHLRNRRMLNPYTFFLYFLSSKNFCSLPPSTSNTVQIAQFDKGMWKLWVFGVRGVSVWWWVNSNKLGFGAQIFLLLHICFWNTKKFCKALVGAPIKFKITQNKLKMRKIRRYEFITKEGSRAIFSKTLKQSITHYFLVFSTLFLYF
jgi:hypothetical protein